MNGWCCAVKALAHANGNAVRALLLPVTGAWSDGDIPHNHPSCSADRGFEEEIGHLLKNGRDISSRTDQTLLPWAAERGDIALVKVVLATRKAGTNSRAKYGLTPLVEDMRPS
jgi:hypothetical protein